MKINQMSPKNTLACWERRNGLMELASRRRRREVTSVASLLFRFQKVEFSRENDLTEKKLGTGLSIAEVNKQKKELLLGSSKLL